MSACARLQRCVANALEVGPFTGLDPSDSGRVAPATLARSRREPVVLPCWRDGNVANTPTCARLQRYTANALEVGPLTGLGPSDSGRVAPARFTTIEPSERSENEAVRHTLPGGERRQ